MNWFNSFRPALGKAGLGGIAIGFVLAVSDQAVWEHTILLDASAAVAGLLISFFILRWKEK